MKKNILFAGILSIIAIFGTVYVYNTFFLEEKTTEEAIEEPVPEPKDEPVVEERPPEAEPLVLLPSDEVISEKSVTLENEVFRLTFTNTGARMSSAVMKNYRGSGGGGAELVLGTVPGILPFGTRAGSFTGDLITAPFHYSLSQAGDEVSFYRDFITRDGRAITCRKTFAILPDEYMIRVMVAFETESGEVLPSNGDGFLYSLEYGPQIGPEYDTLDGRTDYRYYHVSRSGEKRNMRPSEAGFHVMDEEVDWLGIEGKYFTVISVPPKRDYRLAWDSRTDAEDALRLSFFYSMPADDLSETGDTFFYYIGPKDRKILADYNDAADNGYGLEELQLQRIIPGASFMLALADGLKFVLDLLYRIVPNYGIVIILFTIIVELLMLPLTGRSYDTTAKLRRAGPEIKALKQKYQYDREKMMEKLQELYAREEIKGRPNMIPLLVHLPIFLLLFSILNTFIDFRMEMFIPGWIPDISRPDVIIDISPLAVPILGWKALRGLPLLMFVAALIQSRYTQPPDQLGRMMIFMSFLLPILLLFVMYNMPAGVVLYWTVHNLFSIAYQFYRRRKE